LSERELEQLWQDLAGTDAPRAHRGRARLVAVPVQAAPYLGKRLRTPPAAPPEPARVAKLVAGLDSDDGAVREKATAELERLGKAVETAMRKALEQGPSPEARRRLHRLLEKLKGVGLPADELRQVRAVQALEQMGTVEARAVLRELAGREVKGRLRTEAQEALRRLRKKDGGR
jgi:hypothetical protein